MWIAEVDRHVQCSFHVGMARELTAVIIGYRFARRAWQVPKKLNHRLACFIGCFRLQGEREDKPRLAFAHCEQVAALGPELHQVALPMTELFTQSHRLRAFGDGATPFDWFSAAFEVSPSTAGLGARQEPIQLLRTNARMIDKPIDCLDANAMF